VSALGDAGVHCESLRTLRRFGTAQDAFCFTDGTSSGGKTPAAGAHDSPEQAFDCPLCSSLFLAVVVLLALGWLGRRARVPLARPRDDLRGPRQQWPALNSQAP